MARLMEQTRAETLRLFSLVPNEDDLRRPPSPGFRPIMWHRGHIGAYEAYWLLQQSKGDPSPLPEFERIFDPIKTPREDSSSLPSLDEIDAYLSSIRAGALDYLGTRQGAVDWQTYHLVLEHELQHQETLLYLLHLLDPSTKRPLDGFEPRRATSKGPAPNGVVDVEGGAFEMGSNGYPFAYDNERPVHRVDVAPFRIDRHPVTNAQFAGFVDSGGYGIPEYWSEDGWAWREEHGIEHPHAWLPDGRSWRARGLFEHGEIDPSAPVWGVSWYEADAYARWAGRRLPTEAEWEYAARGPASRRFPWGNEAPRPELGNFDDHLGGATPIGLFPKGASPFGVLDMAGNVWEWTASPFDAYPGFEAHPYPEYSELWFDGDHRVAKGGSWATRPPILRSSFRNFFRRNFRIGFVGFRCAG
jgi:iron(II)-dependent oxidoreductase